MSEENKPEQNPQEQPAQPNEAPTEQPEEINVGQTEQPEQQAEQTQPEEQVQEEPAQEAEQPQEQPAQEAPAEQPAQRPMHRQRAPGDENTIFIGRKSTMGYVLAVVTQFNSGAKLVKVKARGKLISKAVDVAEIARGRFLPDVKPSAIDIMTEEVQNEDGTKSKVSSIEISLSN